MQQVQHIFEAVPIRGIVSLLDNAVVGELVVTGEGDQLEFPITRGPFRDARVSEVRSTVESFGLFHVCIIPHSGVIARLVSDLFWVFCGPKCL